MWRQSTCFYVNQNRSSFCSNTSFSSSKKVWTLQLGRQHISSSCWAMQCPLLSIYFCMYLQKNKSCFSKTSPKNWESHWPYGCHLVVEAFSEQMNLNKEVTTTFCTNLPKRKEFPYNEMSRGNDQKRSIQNKQFLALNSFIIFHCQKNHIFQLQACCLLHSGLGVVVGTRSWFIYFVTPNFLDYMQYYTMLLEQCGQKLLMVLATATWLFEYQFRVCWVSWLDYSFFFPFSTLSILKQYVLHCTG